MYTINSQMPPLSQTDYRAIAVNTFQLNLRELYKVQSGALTVVPLEMRNCLSRMDYTTYHQKVRGKPSKMKLKTFIFYPFLETRNQGHFNYSCIIFFDHENIRIIQLLMDPLKKLLLAKKEWQKLLLDHNNYNFFYQRHMLTSKKRNCNFIQFQPRP